MWAWLSYMNPHRLTYGFAYNMPFSQVIAIVLFVSFLFSKEKKYIPMEGIIIIWLMFLVWMCFTSFVAVYPEFATDYYIRVLKIQVLTLLTLMLITNQDKVNKLVWVIALSIGFYSIKGGLFTILSGGSFRVWGPAGTFIEENNGLALASLMVIPLMVYLHSLVDNKWLKYFLASSSVLSLVSVVGSQSRGALISIVAVMGFFWLKTKNKMITGIMIIFLAVVGWNFMPDTWHNRMNTIETYEEDASAMGRINAWIYSINIANNRVTGGGFESWSRGTYALYNPEAELIIVAHSIYFSVLADHGWIGLLLFLLILILTWKNLTKIINFTNKKPLYVQQNMLARMLQISLLAYLVGGTFLSLAYFDLPWHIIAIAFLLKIQVLPNVKKMPINRHVRE
ncbi:probable O-glycosylation ligase, exosortase A-associated [Neptunomonas antarctica]|uniref:Probable O-glycosylation ligase, exosortase A-associated n=2 Tax=Neptunomonas antarctica TaxID=619304 RepID=A0A1N7JEC7_9GAMM|nr:probable O-glycosylation ligase, exosortase A-associated [Neptunomonas antarctica]